MKKQAQNEQRGSPPSRPSLAVDRWPCFAKATQGKDVSPYLCGRPSGFHPSPTFSAPCVLPFSRSRAGVALILALGVLSLLVLLVTAFTVTMRIEHLAARNARDKVRSRQYLHAGFALAAENISGQLVGQLIPSGSWTPTNEPDASTDELLEPLGLSRIPVEQDRMTNGPCFGSGGYLVPGFSNVLAGVATNLLPPGLRERAAQVPAGWTYIISTNAVGGGQSRLSGRVAFLAVDLTGQMDVHHVTTNQYLAASQLDALAGGELKEFTDGLTLHRRYETITELCGNLGLYTEEGIPLESDDAYAEFLDALGVYSYDPNPNQLAYESWVGDRGTVLVANKFDINSITNSFGGKLPDPAKDGDPVKFYSLFDDPEGYFASVSNTIFHANPAFPVANAARAVYWNLINFLDGDRLPQTDTDHPWLDSYGVEAVPLINEFVLSTNLFNATTSYPSNYYTLAVELWYPFATNASPEECTLGVSLFTKTHTVEAFDAFTATFVPFKRIEIMTNASDSVVTTNSVAVTNGFRSVVANVGTAFPSAVQSVGFTNVVPILRYSDEPFHRLSSPEPFAFPVIMTNALGAVETHYLPIGPAPYVTYVPFADPVSGTEILVPITNRVVNTVSYGTRVLVEDHSVDEAPGPRLKDPPTPDLWYTTVTNTFAVSVADPRWNGRVEYWQDQPETLGAINEAFSENVAMFQGLPILHRDGPMKTIGEIGYLGTATPWQSLNLFAPPAAKLLDFWTVNAPGSNDVQWSQGRIHALTEYPAAIRAMFADTRFGTNRFNEVNLDKPTEYAAVEYPLVLDALTNALLAVRGGFWVPLTSQPAMTNATLPFTEWVPKLAPHVATAWQGYADPSDPTDPSNPASPGIPGYDLPGHDLIEDLIRDLPDRVTWRQNLILIFVRAQTLAPNGRVTADSGAAALMVRDSYTGLWAFRQFIPLH